MTEVRETEVPRKRSGIPLLQVIGGIATLLASIGGAFEYSEYRNAHKVLDLSVSGPATLLVGQVGQLEASARYGNGNVQNVTVSATWKSRNVDVVTVANSTARAEKAGDTEVCAEFAAHVGCTRITIPIQSVALRVQGTQRLNVGDAPTRFTATLLMNSGTQEDFTAKVTWQSSDPNIVSAGSDGVITALRVGDADVAAYIGDKAGRLHVTVADPFWTSIQHRRVPFHLLNDIRTDAAAVGDRVEGEVDADISRDDELLISRRARLSVTVEEATSAHTGAARLRLRLQTITRGEIRTHFPEPSEISFYRPNDFVLDVGSPLAFTYDGRVALVEQVQEPPTISVPPPVTPPKTEPVNIVVRTKYEFSTQGVPAGARIPAIVVKPVQLLSSGMIRQGSDADIVMTSYKEPGRGGREPFLELGLRSVMLSDGTRLNLQSERVQLRLSERTKNIAKVAIGTAIGGLLGGLVGKDKKSVTEGAAAGAAVSVGMMLFERAGHLVVPPGTEFTFHSEIPAGQK